jgi:hypothetical protein
MREYKIKKQKKVVKATPKLVRKPDGSLGAVDINKEPTTLGVNEVKTAKKTRKIPKLHLKLPKLKVKKPKPVNNKKQPVTPAKPKQKLIRAKKDYRWPKLPKVPKINLSRKQKKVYLPIAMLMFLSFGGLLAYRYFDKPKVTTQVLGQKTVKPDFSVVYPGGDIKNVANGEIRYDKQRKVANYSDKLNTIDITVSQQPLPDNFKAERDKKIEEFAKANYFNELIQAGELKVYSGLSIKGPQSLVFTKNDLLIFVKASQMIDKTIWIDYINSLK